MIDIDSAKMISLPMNTFEDFTFPFMLVINPCYDLVLWHFIWFENICQNLNGFLPNRALPPSDDFTNLQANNEYWVEEEKQTYLFYNSW